MSVGILARDAAYLAAVAELPLAAHRADHARDAVVVVPAGRAAVDAVMRAQDAGARAFVLTDAESLAPADVAALRAVSRVPVVIPRRRVRPDVVADLGPDSGATLAVVVEASATAADAAEVLRDALAWARLLAGGELLHRAGRTTRAGSLALLEHRALPVTLTRSSARTGTPLIRAHTIGHERWDITVDDGAHVHRVERADAAGTAVAPRRFESLARLTLRRAIAAAEGESSAADLADYLHDAQLADAIGRTPAA